MLRSIAESRLVKRIGLPVALTTTLGLTAACGATHADLAPRQTQASTSPQITPSQTTTRTGESTPATPPPTSTNPTSTLAKELLARNYCQDGDLTTQIEADLGETAACQYTPASGEDMITSSTVWLKSNDYGEILAEVDVVYGSKRPTQGLATKINGKECLFLTGYNKYAINAGINSGPLALAELDCIYGDSDKSTTIALSYGEVEGGQVPAYVATAEAAGHVGASQSLVNYQNLMSKVLDWHNTGATH